MSEPIVLTTPPPVMTFASPTGSPSYPDTRATSRYLEVESSASPDERQQSDSNGASDSPDRSEGEWFDNKLIDVNSVIREERYDWS